MNVLVQLYKLFGDKAKKGFKYMVKTRSMQRDVLRKYLAASVCCGSIEIFIHK